LQSYFAMRLLKLFIIASVLHLLIILIQGGAVFAFNDAKYLSSKGDISLIQPAESTATITPVEESIVPAADNFVVKKSKSSKTGLILESSAQFLRLVFVKQSISKFHSQAIYQQLCCYRN